MDFKIFFAGWQGMARTALIGVLAYAAMVLLLRVWASARFLSHAGDSALSNVRGHDSA